VTSGIIVQLICMLHTDTQGEPESDTPFNYVHTMPGKLQNTRYLINPTIVTK